MATAPTKTTTVKTVNNNTGVTTSSSTKVSGNQTTVTKTTTIGTPKTTSSSASVSTPAASAGAALAERWITGPNDTRPMCGPVAIANHLLAVTGTEAGNGGIERLYRAAGGSRSQAAPLASYLAAAAETGLAGCRLASYERAIVDGAGLLLLALPGVPEPHVAAVVNGAAVMWGDETPLDDLDADLLDAWSLTWHGEDK
jgi:hypothetical protein